MGIPLIELCRPWCIGFVWVVAGWMIRFDSTVPVAHAWLQQEGQSFALDITWDGGGCYFGIPFPSRLETDIEIPDV